MAAGGVALVFMSRGEDDRPESRAPAAATKKPAQPDEGDAEPAAESAAESEKILPESICPTDLSNCTVASGRVLFVEKVDPDGDGDAHFVTASTSSVTGPGITIFDVRADLRPDPLPGIGDLVGGAGPVYSGHAGQKQIEVVEFQVAR